MWKKHEKICMNFVKSVAFLNIMCYNILKMCMTIHIESIHYSNIGGICIWHRLLHLT